MKIRLTRNTVCDKHPVKVGDVVDASDIDGFYLIAIGKAELAEGKMPDTSGPMKAAVEPDVPPPPPPAKRGRPKGPVKRKKDAAV